MKTLALLTALTITFGMTPQGSIDFKPKVGQKQKYAMSTKLDLGGQEAAIVSDIEFEVKKADDKAVEVQAKWAELKVEVGGNEIPVEVTDSTFELSSAGHPLKIRGGIEGSDPTQLYLITLFIPPTEKDLKPGLKYKVDVKEVKDEIPEYTYEGEYVGKETIDGKSVHRFTAQMKTKKEDGVSSKQTVLVREDGVIQKMDVEFKQMDVPAAGAKADGKSTLTLK
jgi:hypothetical protein